DEVGVFEFRPARPHPLQPGIAEADGGTVAAILAPFPPMPAAFILGRGSGDFPFHAVMPHVLGVIAMHDDLVSFLGGPPVPIGIGVRPPYVALVGSDYACIAETNALGGPLIVAGGGIVEKGNGPSIAQLHQIGLE